MYGIPGTQVVGYTADAQVWCTDCLPFDPHGQDNEGNDVRPIFACSDDADDCCSECGCSLLDI